MSPTHFFISSLSCSKGASVSINKVKIFSNPFSVQSAVEDCIYIVSDNVCIIFQEIKDEGILWKVNFPRFHQHFIDMVRIHTQCVC